MGLCGATAPDEYEHGAVCAPRLGRVGLELTDSIDAAGAKRPCTPPPPAQTTPAY